MANETLLSRRGELRPESSSQGEAEAPPSLPKARRETIGVVITNPAWLRYKRYYDTYEEPTDATTD